MSKVVVISGHPNLEQSWTNKVILNQLENNVESIDTRRLDSLYPDYKIDIEAEQAALTKADIIVLQYPYYWYSAPALLKKWIDDVFAFNFAFGPEGDKLKNKHFILSFTVGGPEESYDPLGYNHFTIEQLAYPLQQTAYLAGMVFQKPVYTHRMVYIPGVYNTQEEVEQRANDHAERLLSKIDQLSNSVEAKFELFVKQWFDRFDQLPADNSEFLKHIPEAFELDAVGDKFSGRAGFNDWYQSLLNLFKPGVTHLIEQVSLTPADDGRYNAELRVRTQGEMTNGESLNQLFNEDWAVSMDESGEFTIHSYKVTAV
ncbi:NAD(P)H-dependent oxidoreductase [Vibrio sp. SCSIO 43137]|uniref:NAD(P)H-dependent oxidoreductase n=1 Tax=Vibrio sp. SCSIO 43137 TaxID=3021011 RepID=UPI0023079F76|nr:NAD(P)H-dependent oxidoreductase [Vibrio sp. SCSIO 43137]WCE31835.1 NAD(P)H-dependent oxidoreductase [Vibrio sp. SCSIO 43137]